MRLPSRFRTVAGLAFLLTAAIACGGGGGSAASDSSSKSPSSEDQHKTVSVMDKRTVTVELYDNYFEPAVLTGSPGQTLILSLKNEGKAAHTFTIAGGVDKELQPGQDADVTVTFPQSGATTFYCRFHRSMDMTGLLKVS